MIVEFDGYIPRVAPTAFVAPTAVLIGNVTVGEEASIWYGAVLRADHGEQGIVIGPRSNVQDNCVLHVSTDRGTIVGSDVTIGHGALLEGCEIADGAVIGMNAVVLEAARVGARSMVAAGSTVLVGTRIPDDTMAAGLPAVVKKATTGSTRWWIEHSAGHYVEQSRRYREEDLGSSEQAPSPTRNPSGETNIGG
jgi:carbonic anhydrase/acetyltransferase-like protein (isoleucine patch superfamily)